MSYVFTSTIPDMSSTKFEIYDEDNNCLTIIGNNNFEYGKVNKIVVKTNRSDKIMSKLDRILKEVKKDNHGVEVIEQKGLGPLYIESLEELGFKKIEDKIENPLKGTSDYWKVMKLYTKKYKVHNIKEQIQQVKNDQGYSIYEREMRLQDLERDLKKYE